VVPSVPKKAGKDTYGKVPFLSDNLNPIYAKELRSGLLGKFEYLFRLSYIITILTEVGLLGVMLLGLWDSNYLTLDFEGCFAGWGVLHLAIVVIFGAWFGARAIAPEREGQTLVQLFTIPLQPLKIIEGKTLAVLTFTLYVWILAVPLALLMAILGLIPWGTSLQFLAVEAVMGTLAAAWGVYCSFHGGTVRRALSMSLGGAAIMILAHNLIYPLWDVLRTLKLVRDNSGADVVFHAFPIPMLIPPRGGSASIYTAFTQPANQYWGVTLSMLLIYAVAAFVMLALTARNFRKYAQTV
jgi:ABC-type transport system involved in multi-copper enzyme maturation permease subunit